MNPPGLWCRNGRGVPRHQQGGRGFLQEPSRMPGLGLEVSGWRCQDPKVHVPGSLLLAPCSIAACSASRRCPS